MKKHIKPITTNLKITKISILDVQSLFQNDNKYSNSRRGYSVGARGTSKRKFINTNCLFLAHSLNFFNKNITGKIDANI